MISARRQRDRAVEIRRLILENLADAEAPPLDLAVGLYFLRETALYRVLRDARGRRFRTFRQFCRARRPYGLGMHIVALQAVLIHRARKTH
jgi:hypothetical protein